VKRISFAQRDAIRPTREALDFLLAVFLFFSFMVKGQAQAPVGPEFHANNFGKNPQGYQSVTYSKGGEFLVVWEEMTPDGKAGLWSQWFSASGLPLGKNHLLQVTKSQAYGPLVAPGAHGGALVLWTETHNTPVTYFNALVGGELLPDGSWILPPRRITFLDQVLARFASPLPQGGYAIAILGARPTHLEEDRTFLLLTDDSLKVIRGPSPIFPAPRTTQEVGGLAMSPSGRFLITWTQAESTVLAQIFSPAGRPLSKAFTVPAGGPEQQYAGAAAPLADKGYVIVWSKNITEEATPDLFLRLFKPDGTPQEPDLRLDPEIQFRGLQEVASDTAGNFLVVWQEGGDPPNGGWDIWGRLYHPDGTPYGSKVRLNQYTINDQTNPQVAAGPNGTFVVVWQSTGQDNGDDGIYGRIFAVPASGR
jgi:hypothetical protein